MQQAGSTGLRARPIGFALAAIVLGVVATAAMSASAATLDRIKQASKVTLGYRTDAKPFSFEESGAPAGYTVELCKKVIDQIGKELGIAGLTVDWVPVTLEQRFSDVAQGKVDLLCAADSVTLTRRKDVSFSVPVFPSGISAALSDNAPRALENVLSGRVPNRPIWRASPAEILNAQTFSAVKGTTGETWLADRINTFKLTAKVQLVDTYEAGVQKLKSGETNVLFGDRPILIQAVAGASDVQILDELYTYELLALALPRNDDDFRLAVDRALSATFESGEFKGLYEKWFGKPKLGAWAFFLQSALPE
jgi:polar amino acid transport system substrate-binding protein